MKGTHDWVRFIGGLTKQRFCVNVEVQGGRKASDWLVTWFAKTWAKRWPIVRELEMPDLFWFKVEGGIQKLRGIWNVRVDLSFKVYSPTLEESGDIPLIMRNIFGRESQSSLKSSAISLLCSPSLIGRTGVAGRAKWNAMGVIACQGGSDQVAALCCQREEGWGGVTLMGRVKAKSTAVWLTQAYYLVGRGVPGSEIDRKPTEFLLELYKQKTLGQMNERHSPSVNY